ncbi:MAG: molybdopterin molybdotransferase MoeA [Planctomycetota bacterium]|nr:molybdopterin molybdotransferase MoeA [Planctomycetota bacterium]
MIDVDEALRRIRAAAEPRDRVRVSLAEAAGRVLAEPVTVDRDAPPTDRSAMDGFAVRAADATAAGARLKIVGTAPAGRPSTATVESGSAVRIYTGGVLPDGADSVVMVEATQEDDDGVVTLTEAVRAGQHVRRRGEDRRAGEPLLSAGRRIGAAEIAALATVGASQVDVVRAPEVSVLSTGDELIDAADDPEPHQVRNANAPMLGALVKRLGYPVRDLARVGDDRARLREAIEAGLEADLLLITGGVSVGDYDFVAETLEACGVETLFHKVAMRPGKPVFAGRGSRGLVLGLPGNPVSAFTGCLVLGRPALDALEGGDRSAVYQATAILTESLRLRPGRRTYHLARVRSGRRGLEAAAARTASSGDVLSLERGNAFVVTEADVPAPEAGDRVSVLWWDPFDPRARTSSMGG